MIYMFGRLDGDDGVVRMNVNWMEVLEMYWISVSASVEYPQSFSHLQF